MSSQPSQSDAPARPRSPDEERERIAALHASDLLDSEPEEAFDRLTRLARHLLGVPVSLVSLVDDDRQFFKSQQGLAEPWGTARETPLSHSFCQHVVARNAPFMVNDAREHPLVRENLAIRDLHVVAYLGVPVRGPDGHVFGSICAIDSQPRAWTDGDLAVLLDLARGAESEIALRYELRARRVAERALETLNEELGTLNTTLESRVEQRTAALRSRTDQVRALTHALTLAEQRERQRLAHILHDDLQQVLFGIQIQLQVIGARGASDPSPDSLAYVDELLGRAVTLTRTLSHELAPPALDEENLNVAITWLAEQFTTVHSLEVAVEGDALCPVPDRSLRMVLVQLVRELLFNVAKHADTDRARIRLRACDPDVELTVTDTGAGFDPAASETSGGEGFGMRSVRERVGLMGGRVAVESAPGQGTRITLRVPNVSPLDGDSGTRQSTTGDGLD